MNSQLTYLSWGPSVRDFANGTIGEIATLKALQQAMANSPILAFPNFEKPFIIKGDASAKATGGACLQGNHVDFDKAEFFNPCNFFGRKLSDVERRWPIMDRELLLGYGYKQSKHFCRGRHVIFVTDHKPLVTLNNLNNPIGRTARLLNQLEGSTYEFRYCPGRLNHLADYLSRSEHQEGQVVSSNNMIQMEPEVNWENEQAKKKS